MMNSISERRHLRREQPAVGKGSPKTQVQVVSFEENKPRPVLKEGRNKRDVAFISNINNSSDKISVSAGEKQVTDLARELWNFDSKHARLARDLQRYLQVICACIHCMDSFWRL
jgi:hypothetical protein